MDTVGIPHSDGQPPTATSVSENSEASTSSVVTPVAAALSTYEWLLPTNKHAFCDRTEHARALVGAECIHVVVLYRMCTF